MYELPTSIMLNGQSFAVRNRGDFRTVLDCIKALEDPDLTKEERIVAALIIFYEDLQGIEDLEKLPDSVEAFKEMGRWINCGRDSVGAQTHFKLVDWEKDSMLICSAINNVAQKEIRSEPYIHWWTFMGYYLAIGECSFSTVVSIRNKRARGKKLEKHESQFVIDNPKYFWNTETVEEQELEADLLTIWNNGGSTNG